MSADRRENDVPQPDIEIGAAAKARKLRFRTKPQTEVTFPGSDQERSSSHTERENLPEEVEPGVTYRDVKVRWRGGAHLSARLLPDENEVEREQNARASEGQPRHRAT